MTCAALPPPAAAPWPATAWLRELAFRGNFLVKVVVEVLWLGILLVFYHTVFAQTDGRRRLDRGGVPVLRRLLLRPRRADRDVLPENCNEFAELVRTGDLDFFLLRPIDEQFLITCRNIDWSTAPNVLLGVGVMGWRLCQHGLGVRPGAGRCCSSLTVRVRRGDRLQLPADADVHVGLAGAQPEPDGDVVAVHQPDALPARDLHGHLGGAARAGSSRSSCRSCWSSTCRPGRWSRRSSRG